MNERIIQQKRAIKVVLLVLLLNAIGMTKGYAYDFSAVCSTGQTLYYKITDAANHYVALTCPAQYGWYGFTQPTGSVSLPETVQYEGVTYTVTSIDNYAFISCSGFTGNLTIPNSVTTIGGDAFSYCSGLTSIELSNSLVFIGGQAFLSCTGLTSIAIPNSVTTIDYGAFGSCDGLTSIVIPSSVTSIGVYAFNCSGLEQIIVDSGNTVYDSRNNCNAIIKTNTNELIRGCKNTVVPSSVTTIGDGAFSNCTGLTTMVLPNSVIYIDGYAFSGCSSLTSIEIPNSVTSIEIGAFSDCSGLASIEIPNSVTFIGQSAFWDCTSLTSIEIPSSVTSMGHNPFAGCNGLEQITVDSGNTVFDSRNNCNAIINTSTNKMVVGCKNSFIPNTVTSLGEAFYRCSSLTTIVIPNSVTSIDSWAFSNCSGLTSISISNSVTSIEEYTFSGCSGLISVTIPSSITCIGGGAFSGCMGLISITVLTNTPPSLGTNVFYRVNKSIPVYVPCGSLATYQTTEGWNDFTNCIEMYPGTIVVEASPVEGGTVSGGGTYQPGQSCTISATPANGYTFYKWTQNESIVSFQAEYTFYVTGNMVLVAHFVPEGNIVFVDANVKALCVANWDTNGDGELSYVEAASVTDLGGVFQYNENITSFEELQYFTGLTTIRNSTFINCSNLSGSLYIPNSVTSIGGYAFYGCSGLTGSLTIPNSVTTIGYWAFGNCSGFTGNLTIPNSVTTIEDGTFGNCSGFTGNLTIPNSVTTIGSYAFEHCSGFGSLTLPNSVIEIRERAFQDCSGFTGNLTIGNSVTLIGDLAFYGCSGFTGSLTIGNSVTTIGSYAFRFCSGFTGDFFA